MININIEKALLVISEKRGWSNQYYIHPGLQVKILNNYDKDIEKVQLRWNILDEMRKNIDNNANVEERPFTLPFSSSYIYKSPTKLISNQLSTKTKLILQCFIKHVKFETYLVELPIVLYGLLNKSKEEFLRFEE